MKFIRVFLLTCFGFNGQVLPMQEQPPMALKLFSILDVKIHAAAFISNSVCCVVAIKSDLSSTVSIYDIKAKKTPRLIINCPGQINSISPCDNLKKIAVSILNKIFIFDVETGQQVREYKAHAERVNSLSAHPAFPDMLISGSDDKAIKVWDLRSPVASKVECAHEAGITTVRVSGTPHYFVTGSDDKTTKIWDWNNLKPLYAIKQVAPLSIEYNNAGDRFMICSNHVSRYNAVNAALIATINRTGRQEPLRGSQIGFANTLIPSCASTGNGEQELVALGRDDGKVALCWPDNPPTTPYVLESFTSSVNTLAFCPDGTCLAAGSQTDKKLHVFELPFRKDGPDQKAPRRGSIKGCFGIE